MATVKQKGIIYCTKEQFDTLMSTGSVVIGGVTYTYEDGWQYAVIDKDYVDLTSNQGIEGTKTFIDEANNKSIGINGSGFIYQTGNDSYSVLLPAADGTLVAGIFRHSIKVSNSSGDFIVITAFTSYSAEINTAAKFANYIEASGTGETIYCDGVFGGNSAPMPCAVELINNSGTVGVRYGTDGQGLSTFSVASYSDFVVQV